MFLIEMEGKNMVAVPSFLVAVPSFSKKMYKIAIVGSGSAGYSAAITAAKLDKTARICIIEEKQLGGVCLNEGCIPAKALVKSVKTLHDVKGASRFGIETEGCRANLLKIHQKKDKIVDTIRSQMEASIARHRIELKRGRGRLLDKNTIDFDGEKIKAEYIIIATGSLTIQTDSLKIDGQQVISSTDALNLKDMPESLIIIGAGFIGCEFAYIFNGLGSKVTIIEQEPHILPNEDREIARRLTKSLKEIGIEFILNTKVKGIKRAGPKTEVVFEDGTGIVGEKVLLAIGTKPRINGLGLDAAGVKTEGSKVLVNDGLQTSCENIYAIGDVLGNYYLAHVASYEGKVAAENIFGKGTVVNYKAVPVCVYTMPEIASVGLKEAQAKDEGLDVTVIRQPMTAISMAHITEDQQGMVKLICDSKTGKILGAQIISLCAVELIGELAAFVSEGFTLEKIADIIHPHPTLSEAIQEAAKQFKVRTK